MQTDTDKLFCLLLSGPDTSLWDDAALGVANMTQLMPSAVAMADTTVVESLCSIAVNESVDWFYARVNALRALAALCRLVPKAAAGAVQPAAFGSLRTITKRCER
ncbi:hypothetical protein EVAR_73395_1 [Eumeta japonica]|uniref:Uncharacterized protein n=1 Tax=Eumeta variegata TaxID=151549 RepID=A0A4C1SJN6_EUMVA|nr:hypothetical protein EVAR_73395_1 [Eumeta japonica]